MQAVSAPAWAGAWRRRGLALAVFPLVVAAVALGPSVPAGASGTTSDRSPVDLATPIDLGDGMANQSAIVRSGDVRIEVLSPTLLRLEYSPTGHFENLPDGQRRRPPDAGAAVSGRDGAGWLTRARPAGRPALPDRIGTVHHRQHLACVYSVAGPYRGRAPGLGVGVHLRPGLPGRLGGAAGGGRFLQPDPGGYESTAGYVGYLLEPGARATWQVLGAPSGPASSPCVTPTSRCHRRRRWSATSTCWSTVATATTLTADPNGLAEPVVDADHRRWRSVRGRTRWPSAAGSARAATTDIDTRVGVARRALRAQSLSSPAPWGAGSGGSTRPPTTPCRPAPPGQQRATCQAGLQPLNTDGLLDTAGWRLLDDTQSAVWTKDGWVRPRPVGRGRTGRLPVRLRPRLRRGAAHAGPADRPRSPAPPQHLRRLVFRLHPVLERHHRAARSTRRSWPTTCR